MKVGIDKAIPLIYIKSIASHYLIGYYYKYSYLPQLRLIIVFLFGFSIFNVFHKKQIGTLAPIFALLNCGLCAPPLPRIAREELRLCQFDNFFIPRGL